MLRVWCCAFLFYWRVYTTISKIQINLPSVLFGFRKCWLAYFLSLLFLLAYLSLDKKWRLGRFIWCYIFLSVGTLLPWRLRRRSTTYIWSFSFNWIFTLLLSLISMVGKWNASLGVRMEYSIPLSFLSPEEIIIILSLKPISARCKWVKCCFDVSNVLPPRLWILLNNKSIFTSFTQNIFHLS